MRVSSLQKVRYDANATFALGCKGETSPCWIQKAKPFAGVGQSPTRKSMNKK